jgi:subtilisin family serine protease
MTKSESFKIISNDYADLIIEYNGDINAFQYFPNSSYNIINNQFAVIHIPESNMTFNAVHKYGYSSIPKCFGLMYTSEPDLEKGFYVRNYPDMDYTGYGVLVGFVDGGIDYRNSAFQFEDKTTRIVSIWDQSLETGNYPGDFYYGTEYNREQINEAIASEDPLSIVPSIDTIGQGTALAGIAAGYYSNEIDYTGVAPNAEIVVVKLKQAKPYLKSFFGIPCDKICYQENDIMMGIQYLLQVARRLQRPIAICVGLGSWQGSHKGEDFISRYISSVGEISGVGVIIGAGDEGYRKNHYYGEIIPPSYFNMIELNIGKDSPDFSMELWGYAPNVLTVDIFAPNGELVYQIKTQFIQQNTIPVFYDNTIIFIDNRIHEPFSGDQLILFRFKNTEEGLWRLRISGSDDLVNRFHVWLPIHQFISENIYFLKPNIYTTISIPGNKQNLITVTAYNPINGELYQNASRGYTKTNEPKPDITAPGVNIIAPSIEDTFASFTGTGMAAAHATGVAARLLEWGIVSGNMVNMDCSILRYILTYSAQRNHQYTYPNPDWGFGIIDSTVLSDGII